MARQQAATGYIIPNSYRWVYIVDSAARDVSKFEVLSEIEPGSYNVEVNALPVEPSVAARSQSIWQAVDQMSSEIDVDDLGEQCEQNAASYVINLTCRSIVANRLEHDESFMGLINGLLTNFGILAQVAQSHFGQSRSLITTLKFPDGSTVRVRVTLGVGMTNGQLTLESVEVLSALTAEGIALPINQQELSQYFATNVGQGSIGDLEYMWSGWNVTILRICNEQYQSRTRCGPGPNGQLTCTVEGRISCK